MTTDEFIRKYKWYAIREAFLTGIPASITMAQAILESNSGNSRLATEGKNFFGVKCHDWEGEKIYANDDLPNECFRKYSSAGRSFRDHSKFLQKNSRYNFLWKYPTSDYKAWAHGLEDAGYATSRQYDEGLIALIQRYDLDKLDNTVTVIKWAGIIVLIFLVILISILIYRNRNVSNANRKEN